MSHEMTPPAGDAIPPQEAPPVLEQPETYEDVFRRCGLDPDSHATTVDDAHIVYEDGVAYAVYTAIKIGDDPGFNFDPDTGVAIHRTAVIEDPDKAGQPESEAPVFSGGVIIGPEAHIALDTELGEGVHVDREASVDRGSRIEDFSEIGPGTKIGKDVVVYANVVMHRGVTVADEVTVGGGTVVHDFARIFMGAEVGPYNILGVRATVREGARTEYGVLMYTSADLGREAILGYGSSAGEGAEIGDGSDIRDGVRIGPGVRTGADCVVNINSRIERDSELRARVWIGEFCVVEPEAHLDSDSKVGVRSTVRRGAFLGEGQVLPPHHQVLSPDYGKYSYSNTLISGKPRGGGVAGRLIRKVIQ